MRLFSANTFTGQRLLLKEANVNIIKHTINTAKIRIDAIFKSHAFILKP